MSRAGDAISGGPSGPASHIPNAWLTAASALLVGEGCVFLFGPWALSLSGLRPVGSACLFAAASLALAPARLRGRFRRCGAPTRAIAAGLAVSGGALLFAGWREWLGHAQGGLGKASLLVGAHFGAACLAAIGAVGLTRIVGSKPRLRRVVYAQLLVPWTLAATYVFIAFSVGDFSWGDRALQASAVASLAALVIGYVLLLRSRKI